MFEKVFTWFETRYDPLETQENPVIPSGVWNFCLYFIRQYKAGLFVSLSLVGMLAIIDVLMPVALGWLVDILAEADHETIYEDNRAAFIVGAVVLLLVGPVGILLSFLIEHQTLWSNLFVRFRSQIHWYVLRQSWPFFQNDFAGRIAAKGDQTSSALRQMILRTADSIWYALIYVVGAIVALSSADWRLVLPVIVWMCLVCGYVALMIPLFTDASEKASDARSSMSGAIIDSYTNIQTVKTFSLHEHEDQYASEKFVDAFRATRNFFRIATKIWVPLDLLNYLVIAITVVVGIHLWQTGSISVGVLAMALPLLLRLTGMTNWVTAEVTQLCENIGVVCDGEKLIAQPWAITDTAGAKALVVKRGEVRFDDVKFSYQPKGAETDIVIDGIDLNVRPGEKIGLVGRSGAGKSTLVNLLLRFYDLSIGRILIDGQSICDVTQDSLRANIAMVSQDSSLMHRSIRDNILIDRPGASDDAHAGERGVKLSGG
ncbi:MAG: ABC transporter ATP-binding protein [Hyphomicrobiales bacterium]